MLSRSAEDLFWMTRYMERAENTARILDVSSRMALLPSAEGSRSLHWAPALQIGPDPEAFYEHYEKPDQRSVISFMALDRGNPSSIWCCIREARENARAERSKISTEMWESLNDTWLEVQNLDFERLEVWGYRKFFDWIKNRSHLFRGVTLGTLIQDDGFQFARLGAFFERADNTARILDVKYHVLLPSPGDIGGVVDYYQWGALLRSVSAFAAYRKVYRDAIRPSAVAEMLILNEDLPRSLHACHRAIGETLDDLCDGRKLECRRLAGEIHACLKFGRIDEVIEKGLHEFLNDFILRNNRLGSQIQQDFMMTDVVVVN